VKAWVGVTDWSWYQFLSAQRGIDEVNFWQPGGSRAFSAIEPGEIFLFKLRRPHDVIAGGGFFAHSALPPLSLAWESFKTGNGAESLAKMKTLIDRYRSKQAIVRGFDYYNTKTGEIESLRILDLADAR
jgi:putative restriction endonuclease